ncbi:MAG: dTMP kinase [Fimbriimonadaceae bacterium]|nr:dTMP kinase [Alphaproteobacteria bacterium]
MVQAGKFVTFEGGEGTGKSTQAALLVQRLAKSGIDAVQTREPGGTPGAEIMRHLLKSGAVKPLGTLAEAVIVSAARDDHLTQVIRPALAQGKWVVCDRFADSTRVYQGTVGGLEPQIVNALERMVVSNTRPDLTILLDAPAEEGMKRAQLRHQDAGAQAADRFDEEDIVFHKKLRDSFLDLARAEPDRFVVIDATKSVTEIAEAIWVSVNDKLLVGA